MLTFQDNYQLCQQISGDYSAERLVQFKRDINEGDNLFINRLGRAFNREFQKASIVANQQYYQFPSEVLRISEIQTLNGTTWETPELVASEDEWNRLNATVTKGSSVEFYYIRGFNELGLYPIPSAAITAGLSISYEPAGLARSQDDFTTGTVTATANQQAITHSATGFTQQMVGRWFQITDGTDSRWYRIGSFTSTSVLQLENYFDGIGSSGRSFRIGEVAKIPEGYQDAGSYYALDKFYQTQNDPAAAATYKQRFDGLLKDCRKAFSRSTTHIGSRQHVRRHGDPRRYWIDRTKSVTYP